MFFKRHLMKILRWGLRLHGVGHLIEVFSAIAEGAYITATIANAAHIKFSFLI